MNLFISNEAVVFGILMSIVGFVSYTSSRTSGFWYRFHKIVPPLLLCYFLPALFHYPLGLISETSSKIGSIGTQFFLPASLVLLCIGADVKGLSKLGAKSIIMFFTGTIGVILGGLIALGMGVYFFSDTFQMSSTELAKGLATICGSWIGGSANQAAIKEIYQVPENLFGMMVVVDVVNGYASMALLLYGTEQYKRIDKWLRADSTAIEELKIKMTKIDRMSQVNPNTHQLMYLLATTFTIVGISHFLSDLFVPIIKQYSEFLNAWKLTALLSSFFWMVVFATTIGLILSFTKFRNLESYGASRWGSIFLYILVTTIGMKMDLAEILRHPELFILGFVWICTHLITMFIVAYFIRAPYFYIAVGSTANVGGAASAPIVASAFHPALAPVGVVMAVIGYAIGTYGAIVCAQLMLGFL
jgi:uncharacterized membrane protein